MNYPYKAFPLSQTDPVTQLDYAFRPVLKVIIGFHRSRTVPLESLLDTGSDHSIFHAEVGEQLGIPLTSGKSVRLHGIGGTITGFLHDVTITVAAQTYRAPVVFAPGIGATGILGQIGFFDHFVATFDWTPNPPEFDLRRIPRN